MENLVQNRQKDWEDQLVQGHTTDHQVDRNK